MPELYIKIQDCFPVGSITVGKVVASNNIISYSILLVIPSFISLHIMRIFNGQ